MTSSASISPHGRWQRWVLWVLVAALAWFGLAETWALMHFQPPGLDFLPLWTAGRMAWTAPAKVYDFAAVTQAQAWLLPHLHWPRPYAYPPTALLILAPFGLLPFWTALVLWTALGLGVLVYAGIRLGGRERWLAAALIVVSPPVVIAILVGQTVLLAAGLATLALVELKGRPRLAGALLALAAALKPQAIVLAPVALLAGGAFEALASAAVVGTALAAVSALVFGPQRWLEWLGSLAPFQAVIQAVPSLMVGVITPFGTGFELGLTGLSMILWRAAFALAGVGVVWWVFARRGEPALRLGALLAGGILASPYALHYDGSLLVPAAAAMALGAIGGRGWPLSVLALGAVCEITQPRLGAAMVVVFLVLSLIGALVVARHGSAQSPPSIA